MVVVGSFQDADAIKASKVEEAKRRAIAAGRVVASAPPGDEIVITGA